jgi:hypothetical protein
VIISASTVKDTRENVEKFVRRNLLGGIDHMVVFMDAPMPEMEQILDGHADVTPVRAHGDWWAGQPPGFLNERQMTNSGLLSRLVTGYPWAEWMFMLDGDEVAQIDRGVLDRLDPDVRAVRLTPMEAVSRLRPAGDPTLFKRMLSQDELTLLAVLGTIPAAKGRSYFRGHVTGKPGLRPSPGLALGLHHIVDTATGDRLPLVSDPGLTVLHYESHDGQEFVRKWLALLGSGGSVKQHRTREPLARSVSALMALDLSDAERAAWLEKLFERCALDDVDTLTRLRLLVEVDPDARVRSGPPAPPDAVRQLRALLERAYGVPKKQFHPRARARAERAATTVTELQRGI